MNTRLACDTVNLRGWTDIDHLAPDQVKLTPDVRCPVPLIIYLLMLFISVNVHILLGRQPTSSQEAINHWHG